MCRTRTVFTVLLIFVCYQLSIAFHFNIPRQKLVQYTSIKRILSFNEKKLKNEPFCQRITSIHTQPSSKTESEIEFDRQLAENDEDDGDYDSEDTEYIIDNTDNTSNYNMNNNDMNNHTDHNDNIKKEIKKESHEELEESDINLISETDIDKSIQLAVKKLVDNGPKVPEISRVDLFENMYKV